MDFELPGEDHPKRKAVRAWFEANPQPSGRDLARAGYMVPHWPKPWGLAAEPELQLIIDEEMKRAGVVPPHNPVAINNCAQSLLTHGTEAQRRRFLPPALSGEELWCMLFSEPSGVCTSTACSRSAVRITSWVRTIRAATCWPACCMAASCPCWPASHRC